MKNNLSHFCLSMLMCLMASNAMGKVKLPNYLASNMTLQQQSEVNFWGSTRAKGAVTVKTSWDNKTYRTSAGADGKFSVKIKTPAASNKPQRITVSDGEATVLDNVLIGEVWFCSGQSNMEMPMRGFDRQPLRDGSNDVIAHAKASTPIRMFLTDKDPEGRWFKQAALTPQEDIIGRWCLNTPENVSQTSAVAYYFAQYVQDVLDIPVGIIVSTLGGSDIVPWMSDEALPGPTDPKGEQHVTPHVLYNGKVAPLTKLPIKGFIWYQGEANVWKAPGYSKLMVSMVKDWREKWNEPDAPFYFVEIAPWKYDGDNGMKAAVLREEQQIASHEIPNCGMISCLDDGVENMIHTVNKKIVGSRLALYALGKTYGLKGFGYEQPMYKDCEVKDGKIYINVTGAVNGLCPMWTSLKGFEIAGADKVFHPAFAEIEDKTCRLAVSSTLVPNPVAVRYCFKNYAEASVFNVYGLPLAPFRTDNWQINENFRK